MGADSFDVMATLKNILSVRHQHTRSNTEVSRQAAGFKRFNKDEKVMRLWNVPRDALAKYFTTKCGIDPDEAELMISAKIGLDKKGSIKYEWTAGGELKAELLLFGPGSEEGCAHFMRFSASIEFEYAPDLVVTQHRNSGSFLFFSWDRSEERVEQRRHAFTLSEKATMEMEAVKLLGSMITQKDLAMLEGRS